MTKAFAVPLIDLAAETAAVRPELDAAIASVLDRGWFILGDAVARFEEQFAQFCGARYAVGVASGLAALELSLRACDVGPGDEVVTAANTFMGTVLAILHVGATPVLVDPHPESFNVDVAAVEAAITRRTRAILPVHLYGQPAEMDALRSLADRHGLRVIEDACQAHGAAYAGQSVGTFGAAGCFSFYPTKNLGALGDGGAVVTDDPVVRDRLVSLRNYGEARKNVIATAGYNERLDTLQAAILSAKLPRLTAWNNARARHAALYDALLADAPIARPAALGKRTHVWHLYVIRAPRRDELAAFLSQRGIITGIHYPLPVHRHPMFADSPLAAQRFPVAERLSGEILSLPLFPTLCREQIEHVAACVNEFFGVSPKPAEPAAVESAAAT